ncbi:MAG: dTDP-4-dehydrorhamnose 3,5-epimerase [Pseudomonadales bacterium]|jgi:dTDP-4-dehydrorhamnose 3,5-epimerase|nr:dTDP-4-dehydrorhamnose 3,5-epimerase [Pseudomonadales bacterium]
MAKFEIKTTPIEGLIEIYPKVFGDDRGYFMETYNEAEFYELGLEMKFVQDNQSKSKRGVLRGLHFQTAAQQGKLVRAISGEVFDVAVDIRKDSPTYGKWHGVILSAEQKNMFYVPEGFAHGFLVLSETAEFVYKCTNLYRPEFEGGLRYDDSEIGIEWPLDRLDGVEISLSEKDTNQPTLADGKIFL